MRSVNRPVFHVLAIIVFILLAYSNSLNGPFIFDDAPNIANNPVVKNLHYFADTSGLERIANPLAIYKPLLMSRYMGYLTLALNYAVHGVDVRGYHLVNLLIHLGVSLLLYGFVILTFKTPAFLPDDGDPSRPSVSRNFVALFTALLFAVHPVQTQAVTYIVQRFASLATLFWLLSLVSYILFRLSSGQATGVFRRSALYAVSLLSAVLAMKTKEMALLLPVVIVLYEFMFLEGGVKRRLRYLTPICLTMAIIPLSMTINSGSGLVASSQLIASALGGTSRLDYLLTQFRVIVTYLRLLLFPVNQMLDYDYPIYHSFFTPPVFISFLLLLTIFLVGGYLLRLSRDLTRKNRHLYRLASFGIFWFFISLSIESSIFPIDDVIYEHRLYLPSIGFFLALVSAIELLRVQWGERTSSVRAISVYAMLLLTAGLSTAAYARNSLWRDGLGLLEDNARLAPGKARVHSALGNYYAGLGRLDEANRSISKAIEINHKDAETHYNLGNSLAEAGRLEEATVEYKRSIILRPYFADARCNLAAVYVKQGRLDEAIWVYTTAIRVDPQSVKARNNLGNIYNKQGRLEEALGEYQEALRINPDFAEAHYNLGNTLTALGRVDEAKNEYITALRIRPDFIEARRQLEK